MSNAIYVDIKKEYLLREKTAFKDERSQWQVCGFESHCHTPLCHVRYLKAVCRIEKEHGSLEVTYQDTNLNETAFTGNPAHSRTRGDQTNKHRGIVDILENQYLWNSFPVF